MKKYTATYEKRGKWYIGYVREVPGANTQGRTLEEARENLKEAVELVLEAQKKLSPRAARRTRVIREPILVHAAR
ncbi:MAG: type II toxin-antitoxin system HicB family antitoxin [Candidatus Coatesbacteria bacterium]